MLYRYVLSVFFFFFQAEDGIRDHCVTGVQTCALPICAHSSWTDQELWALSYNGSGGANGTALLRLNKEAIDEHNEECGTRSEERRVGKECRSRWAPEREKKKKSEKREAKIHREKEVDE